MTEPLFRNLYSTLPAHLYASQMPEPVQEPTLFALNEPLAAELGLSLDWLRSEAGLGLMSGNQMPEGAAPLAQAYAGHQFGNWVPQLGDGRAVLVGEIDTPNGAHVDLQLKGSGRTPFSRGGDGRAALGPVIREYLISEAMHALGLPTTRALAVVTTGQPVYRDVPLPGAVLTRVAASHIRVGTFQYFAARKDNAALQALYEHVVARHYPDAQSPLELLDQVMARQAALIAGWMSVGFIHGVMNTDNMALSGETIDYGPCAFMDEYHPLKVFSSIDRMGRYAFSNQARIAAWNLAQFASCLLPLMDMTQDAAIEAATDKINQFGDLFEAQWLHHFCAKLGLAEASAEHAPLIEDLLALMAKHEMDFTQTFTQLTAGHVPENLVDWVAAWRLERCRDASARMAQANPVIIPRNHKVEQVIAAAYEGNSAPFEAMLRAVRKPFSDDEETAPYQAPPLPEDRVTQTFCGT